MNSMYEYSMHIIQQLRVTLTDFLHAEKGILSQKKTFFFSKFAVIQNAQQNIETKSLEVIFVLQSQYFRRIIWLCKHKTWYHSMHPDTRIFKPYS